MFNKRAVISISRSCLQAYSRTGNRWTSSASPRPLPKPDSNASMHRTTKYDKWLLEHFKKYPKGQAPDFVPGTVMERYRSLGQIKLNIAFGVCCLIGILAMVYKGKRERAAGYSVHQMNLEWHSEENRKLDQVKKQ